MQARTAEVGTLISLFEDFLIFVISLIYQKVQVDSGNNIMKSILLLVVSKKSDNHSD